MSNFQDTEDYPEKREDQCLNCGMHWDMHSGWACPSAAELGFYKK